MNVFIFLEFVINPNGKSEVCILHEYMQRVLKVRPVYNFFECGKCFAFAEKLNCIGGPHCIQMTEAERSTSEKFRVL